MSSFTLRKTCASCGSSELQEIIDYGQIPLAGCFPKEMELDSVETYPFALLYCASCTLVQANGTVDPDLLFKDYRYLSSVGLSGHFNDLASHVHEHFGLTRDSRIVEIGANDGVFLVPMMELGHDIVGFEPSDNVSRIATERGCRIFNEYFSLASATKHLEAHSVDLLVACNCFAHIDGINDVVQGISHALRPEGHAVIEVHYVKSLVEELQYDFAYHEHIYYYSVTALSNLFARHGMTVVDFEEIPVHSGSLRVYVRNEAVEVPSKVSECMDAEAQGVAAWDCYTSYARDVLLHKQQLMELLRSLKAKALRVVGYGASGRANVLCNFCGIDSSLVDYIVDESPERYDRFIPVRNIPIKRKEYFDSDSSIDYVLILAWNYSKAIIRKLQDRDFRFIIPFPQPREVHDIEDVDEMISL